MFGTKPPIFLCQMDLACWRQHVDRVPSVVCTPTEHNVLNRKENFDQFRSINLRPQMWFINYWLILKKVLKNKKVTKADAENFILTSMYVYGIVYGQQMIHIRP
jgi:hypothetical protein